jgi:endonuclease-3
MGALDDEYGPRPWESRGRAVDVLVETVLSQNTSDVNSHRAFESLLSRFGSLEAAVSAEVADIEEVISNAGLSRIKSARIKEILVRLVLENGSLDLSFLNAMEMGAAREYLTSFRGVGQKTASCVLLFAMGRPALPVDTHVHRVSRRLGLIGRTVTAEAAQTALEELVPPPERYRFPLSASLAGRAVATVSSTACAPARSPRRRPPEFNEPGMVSAEFRLPARRR